MSPTKPPIIPAAKATVGDDPPISLLPTSLITSPVCVVPSSKSGGGADPVAVGDPY